MRFKPATSPRKAQLLWELQQNIRAFGAAQTSTAQFECRFGYQTSTGIWSEVWEVRFLACRRRRPSCRYGQPRSPGKACSSSKCHFRTLTWTRTASAVSCFVCVRVGGAAPGAIPTNVVITAVDIPRKYRPPSIPKVGSCSRSTARRYFQWAKEANGARAFEVPTWHEHEPDASWAVILDN